MMKVIPETRRRIKFDIYVLSFCERHIEDDKCHLKAYHAMQPDRKSLSSWTTWICGRWGIL